MPLTRQALLVIVVVTGLSPGAHHASAQVEDAGADQDALEKETLRETRALMRARWNKLRAFERVDDEDREVAPVREPIFVFSESTRESGHLGTLWVWGKKGRPVALLSQNKAFGEPVWGFELAALSQGVSVEMHDGWKWSPASALKMIPFEDAPRADESKERRLSQMKDLAREFSVSEQYRDEHIELRLLPRPVYRYQDEEAGLIDGTLFTFAHGTNPEALVVIEARQQTSGPTWSYGFLPLAGAGVTATLDGKTVWTKEPTRETKAQEVYSTWLEKDTK